MKSRIMSVRLFPVLLLMLILNSCGGSSTSIQYAIDPVEKSFVAMGDLQIAGAQSVLDNPSTTNIPQLRQNVADIVALPHKPDYSFILGDLVKGEENDEGQALQTQLDAWMTVFQGLPGSAGINLIPLPGNHEMDYKDKTVQDEAPLPYAYPVWSNWIETNNLFPFAANGPKPEGANPDQLVQDESRYTFSFDWGAIHIVVINTDTLSTVTNPATGLIYNGWIPINWIAADLAAAQANPAINTILLMGHRPIEAPDFVVPPLYGHTILAMNQYQLASDLATLLQNTPKVKAYFCSHSHAFSAARLKGAPRVWQIVSGNGGALLESSWTPAGGQYFGFSELRLHKSGRLSVANYGRAVPPPPQAFYEGSPVAPAPARLREIIVLD